MSLALSRFETGVCFVDDIDAPFATHHLTIWVAIFERFNGRYDFHNV